MDIIERFKKYVSFDTTSSETIRPGKASTDRQYAFGKEVIYKELKTFKPDELDINGYGVVRAVFKPSEEETLPRVALFCHMDTSPAAKGSDIKPRVIKYEGGDIDFGHGVVLHAKDYPYLKKSIGHQLIIPDGTTLLGGDDKAGCSAVMDFLEKLPNHRCKHRTLEIHFTTDEETGEDAKHVSMDKVKAKFGITVDGEDLEEINIETFNALAMHVDIKGFNIHPGASKNRMINANMLAIEFDRSLPWFQRPEFTEEREGFYHLCNMTCSEEHATMEYIIRDHDLSKAMHMAEIAKHAGDILNEKYGEGRVTVTVVDTYHNMIEKINECPESIKLITNAFKALNVPYSFVAVRGGTTGSQLSFMGLPTPNIGDGDFNPHGRMEYVDADQMAMTSKILAQMFKD